MAIKNQEPETKKLSIELHRSVSDAVAEIAKDENRTFSSQLKQFVNKGLEAHGIKVRGNQVAE